MQMKNARPAETPFGRVQMLAFYNLVTDPRLWTND